MFLQWFILLRCVLLWLSDLYKRFLEAPNFAVFLSQGGLGHVGDRGHQGIPGEKVRVELTKKTSFRIALSLQFHFLYRYDVSLDLGICSVLNAGLHLSQTHSEMDINNISHWLLIFNIDFIVKVVALREAAGRETTFKMCAHGHQKLSWRTRHKGLFLSLVWWTAGYSSVCMQIPDGIKKQNKSDLNVINSVNRRSLSRFLT